MKQRKAKITLQLKGKKLDMELKGTGEDLLLLLVNCLDKHNPANKTFTDLLTVAMQELVQHEYKEQLREQKIETELRMPKKVKN